MMLPLTSATPTTAERIRSACVRAGGALLAVEGEDPVATPVHHLLRDGSFAVAVPVGPLDLIATEYPNPALLQVETPRSRPSDSDETRYALMRLEIVSVVVTDATGAEPVSLTALLDARPDPFCEIESTLLWHLTTDHNDVVTRLVSRLPAPLRRGQVRPLGLDRYGVRFRIEDGEGDHDIRLPFHKPVDDMTGLSQAIRVLMGCPFLNGLRARR